jgi:hypothetical protein
LGELSGKQRTCCRLGSNPEARQLQAWQPGGNLSVPCGGSSERLANALLRILLAWLLLRRWCAAGQAGARILCELRVGQAGEMPQGVLHASHKSKRWMSFQSLHALKACMCNDVWIFLPSWAVTTTWHSELKMRPL